MTMSLQPLAPDAVEKIHRAGLDILAQVGVVVEDEDVSRFLATRGCECDSTRVRMPPRVVEAALTHLPAQVVLYHRNGSPACHLGSGATYVQPVGGTPFVIDLESGMRRPALLRDLQHLVYLIDNLDHIHLVTVPATPTDVDDELQAFVGFATALKYSSKPVSAPGPSSVLEVEIFARLAEAVYGDLAELVEKPRFIISILPASPLRFPRGTAQAIVETARLGVPMSVVPLPVMGISSPFTLAGALAQQHAENLATVTIAQLVRPGVPMIYHGRLSTGDMRTGASLWGIYEIGLAGAAAVALGRRCRMPTNVYGLSTSAKVPDVQSGLERMANALVPLLAGADVLGGAGSLGDIMAVSPLQLVIDDEIIASAFRLRDGFSVEDDQFPLEVIGSVVDSGEGMFLSELHTVHALRRMGQWLGEVSDRSSYDEFERAGRRGMVELAQTKAQTILANTGQGPTVSREVHGKIEAVLAAAKAQLAK